VQEGNPGKRPGFRLADHVLIVINAVDVPGTEGCQEGGAAACAAAEVKQDLAPYSLALSAR
jgi:hypothetical protein